jgi:hypothetical protein
MVDRYKEAAIYLSTMQPDMAFRDADSRVRKIQETEIGIEST